MTNPNIVSNISQSIADLRAEGEVAWAENRAVNAQFVEQELLCDSKAIPVDSHNEEEEEEEEEEDDAEGHSRYYRWQESRYED